MVTPNGRGRRRALAVAVWVGAAGLALAGAAACGAAPGPPEKQPRVVAKLRCDEDEIREYHCDPFLPLHSTLPADPPYDSCPGSVQGLVSRIDGEPKIGVFDAAYTKWVRARTPPGHACCYSHCAQLDVTEPVDQAEACSSPLALREHMCLEEPEAGTTRPAPAPYERCPRALKPPAVDAFSSPVGAPFNPRRTAHRRRYGFLECCYDWCSQVPGGAGL